MVVDVVCWAAFWLFLVVCVGCVCLLGLLVVYSGFGAGVAGGGRCVNSVDF